MPSSDRFEIIPNTVPGEKPWLLRRILASGTLSWHMSDATIDRLHEVLGAHIAGRQAATRQTPPARIDAP